MKRKRFLQLFAGGIAISAIPGIWFLRKDARQAAINIITYELHYLKLDKNGVEKFVDDYLKSHSNNLFKNEVKAVDMLGISSGHLGYTEFLVKDYLLSSSFFKNKMDESKIVEYSGNVYNPYKTPCGNPFSFFYFPQSNGNITVS